MVDVLPPPGTATPDAPTTPDPVTAAGPNIVAPPEAIRPAEITREVQYGEVQRITSSTLHRKIAEAQKVDSKSQTTAQKKLIKLKEIEDAFGDESVYKTKDFPNGRPVSGGNPLLIKLPDGKIGTVTHFTAADKDNFTCTVAVTGADGDINRPTLVLSRQAVSNGYIRAEAQNILSTSPQDSAERKVLELYVQSLEKDFAGEDVATPLPETGTPEAAVLNKTLKEAAEKSGILTTDTLLAYQKATEAQAQSPEQKATARAMGEAIREIGKEGNLLDAAMFREILKKGGLTQDHIGQQLSGLNNTLKTATDALSKDPDNQAAKNTVREIQDKISLFQHARDIVSGAQRNAADEYIEKADRGEIDSETAQKVITALVKGDIGALIDAATASSDKPGLTAAERGELERRRKRLGELAKRSGFTLGILAIILAMLGGKMLEGVGK